MMTYLLPSTSKYVVKSDPDVDKTGCKIRLNGVERMTTLR
jgi:hypothetical protein